MPLEFIDMPGLICLYVTHHGLPSGMSEAPVTRVATELHAFLFGCLSRVTHPISHKTPGSTSMVLSMTHNQLESPISPPIESSMPLLSCRDFLPVISGLSALHPFNAVLRFKLLHISILFFPKCFE